VGKHVVMKIGMLHCVDKKKSTEVLADGLTLKMETPCTSDMLVLIRLSTQRTFQKTGSSSTLPWETHIQ